MRKKRYWFNSASASIDGIDEVLYEALTIAHQNNNSDIIHETIDVIDDALRTALNTASLVVFERNISLIRRLYYLSLSNGKHSLFLKTTSYSTIRSKASSIIRRIDENLDTNNEILIKDFLRYTLTQYNILLHELVINKDIETYKEAIRDFYTQIFKLTNFHELTLNEGINKYKEESDYYIISIAILQYSWTIYLYKKGKLSLAECLEFICWNKINVKYYEKILDALMYLDSTSSHDFGTRDWENDTRVKSNLDSIAYSSLPIKYWTGLGMMILLLRNSSWVTQDINPSFIKSIDGFFSIYFDQFQECISEIKENREIWIPVIFNNALSEVQNANLEEEFLNRIEYVSNSLKRAASQLIKIEFVVNNQKLSEKPFSEFRVAEFKEKVGSLWYQKSFLYRLFEKYGNYNIVTDELEPIGNFYFEPRMKMMFVEVGYNFVINSTDFGRKIAEYEDGKFLDSIKTVDKPIHKFGNIINCLNRSIEKVQKNGFIPTVIIVGSELYYSSASEDLQNSEEFIPYWKLRNSIEDEVSAFSTYKAIPLYISSNKQWDNTIVIADFENAFLLDEVQNNSWYKNVLQVDTIPIDSKEAKRIFDEHPTDWKMSSAKGMELTEEEAISYIKTGVTWDIWIRTQFKVKNALAYTIAEISEIDDEVENLI